MFGKFLPKLQIPTVSHIIVACLIKISHPTKSIIELQTILIGLNIDPDSRGNGCYPVRIRIVFGQEDVIIVFLANANLRRNDNLIIATLE